MREIEIKLRVKNLEELEKSLLESGVMLSHPINQRDVVYSSKSVNWRGAIRIRYEDGGAELTLKKELTNEMDNIECETKVEKPEEIHKMLEILDWEPEVEVVKIRRKGKMGKYEICVDRVEHLGNFVELEKMTDDNANPNEVRKELFEALKPFGLSEADEETRGYDTQIYQLNNIK